jgi:hypothetical protein
MGVCLYPDGLLRARRGQKQWTALVEVKTGVNELGTEQLEAYLDIAREQEFDAVITIGSASVRRHGTVLGDDQRSRCLRHASSRRQMRSGSGGAV